MATIQSVERALHLLSLVAAAAVPIGVRELARRSGLTVPTAQNLLKTLAATGFLSFDEGERKYRVGLSALLVADAGDPVTCIRAAAHRTVEDLQAATGATAVLMAYWRGQCMVADWCAPEQGLAVRMRGRIVENPFGMATGRVLMAWHPDLVPDDLEIRGCLSEVRAQGYAATENLGDSGVYAVAAPVREMCGRVVLALGCSTSLFGLDSAERGRIRESVLVRAAALGSVMQPFGE